MSGNERVGRASTRVIQHSSNHPSCAAFYLAPVLLPPPRLPDRPHHTTPHALDKVPDMRSASGTFHTGPDQHPPWGLGFSPCRCHCSPALPRAHQPGPSSRGLAGLSPGRADPQILLPICHLAAVAPSGSLVHVLTPSLVHSRDWVARYPISLLWSARPGRILTGRVPLEPPWSRSSVLGLTSPAALADPGLFRS